MTMKKLLILFFAVGMFQTALAQEEKVSDGPAISFKEKLYDFGVISRGDTVEHTFYFENIGTAPLKILSARGSCGCTVPKYSREEIAPGAKGEVFVRFNSAGKSGMQNKTVTLVTNATDVARKQVVLTLRGRVDVQSGDDD
ncbi:MAG: hypothetical protein Roseis3KO_27450 [Roseivirga sp.]